MPVAPSSGRAETTAAAVPALKVTGLTRRFGALVATDNITLSVAAGERRAIIGPNGAGKTTFFNVISGALPATSGRIELSGRDVTTLPDWKRVRLGLARTFQRNNLFTGLSVFENVRLALQRRLGYSYRLGRAVDALHDLNEQVGRILEMVGLDGRGEVLTANLSYGEQRQLEVALALSTAPATLLLDEPTAGMSAAETGRMVSLIKKLPATLTLLIVEHDMEVVFALADQITVLHLGAVLTQGTPQTVQADPRVREVYLGEAE